MNYFNRNKWWAIAFLLLVALNVATLLTFWLVKGGRPGPPPMRAEVVDYLTRELGFDSLQKQKLTQLFKDHQEKMQELRNQTRTAKDAFFDLLQKPGTPDSVIEKAAQQAAHFDSETDVITFKHFQQIRNLCNDTQKQKFDAVIKQVLRMNAPPPPGEHRGPPPGREGEGMHDGPPPGERPGGPPPPQN